MFLAKGFNKAPYYNKIEVLKKEDYVRKVILQLRDIEDEDERRTAIEKEAKELLSKVSIHLLKYPEPLENLLILLKDENEHDIYLVLRLEIDMLYMHAIQFNYKTLEKAAKTYKKFREDPLAFRR